MILICKILSKFILPIQIHSLRFYSLTLSHPNTCKPRDAYAQVVCRKSERTTTFSCSILTFSSAFFLMVTGWVLVRSAVPSHSQQFLCCLQISKFSLLSAPSILGRVFLPIIFIFPFWVSFQLQPLPLLEGGEEGRCVQAGVTPWPSSCSQSMGLPAASDPCWALAVCWPLRGA